ncbi:MAG: Bifunctional glutamine synthetase adenylyltransferase/adenylyl-removing enzyme, partial [Gammaproteobacteria bacterium]|nr:Bifunctional glutamine synthetase adenylyltransferase/adenylyl-removing enzyme [Gammaproteobacteria bacterium]
MEHAGGTGAALARAWHQQSAQSSLERWLEVCNKEGWGEIPADLPLLIAVFGASWDFTRYIFC